LELWRISAIISTVSTIVVPERLKNLFPSAKTTFPSRTARNSNHPGNASRIAASRRLLRYQPLPGRKPGHDSDGPTIGLILCAEKNEAIARYSVLNEHTQLFAAKYLTYLPSVEELERELERERRIAEAIIEAPRAAKPSSRSKGRKR